MSIIIDERIFVEPHNAYRSKFKRPKTETKSKTLIKGFPVEETCDCCEEEVCEKDLPKPKQSFPVKDNRTLMLSHIAPKYSYMIDLMFCPHVAYLVAININTRYLFVEPTNTELRGIPDFYIEGQKRDTESYLNALQRMFHSSPIPMYCKHLKGDMEGAFSSDYERGNRYHREYGAMHYYQKWGIEFHGVNPKRKLTGNELSIVDRIIRTLRDMNYNLGLGSNISVSTMRQLVHLYNRTIHTSLSKTLGFPVSPLDIMINPELEDELVKRKMQHNYLIRSGLTTKEPFYLEPGTQVKLKRLYRRDEKRRGPVIDKYHTVVSQEGRKVRIRPITGDDLIIARTFISIRK